MRWKVGDKLRFKAEKRAYTVQAINDRFAFLTKPFNVRRTVLYTIVDFAEHIRGTENLIFCLGFETREQCEEALERLTAGKTKISHRNQVPLDLEQ